MTVTDAEYRELRYRVDQQGQRIQQLEQTKHFVSSDGTFSVFTSTGGVAVRMGKLSNPTDYDIEVRTSTGGYVRLEDLLSPQFAQSTADISVAPTTFSTQTAESRCPESGASFRRSSTVGASATTASTLPFTARNWR